MDMVLRPARETRKRRECLDSGDESVRMEPAEQPSDLTWVHVFVWFEGISGEPQFLSHIAVGETVQGVFPRQEHLKEHALVSRQRIKGSDRPAVFGRCVGRQRIEIPHGGSGSLVPGSRHPGI